MLKIATHRTPFPIIMRPKTFAELRQRVYVKEGQCAVHRYNKLFGGPYNVLCL